MVTGSTSARRRRKAILHVRCWRGTVCPMVLTSAVQVSSQVRLLRGIVVFIRLPRIRRRQLLMERSFRIGV